MRIERSGARLHQELQSHGERFEVRLEDNIGVAFASDVVMLACKPYDAQKVVAAPGIADALHGKGIIGILPGLTSKQIRETITRDKLDGIYDIIRAGPNVGARVEECMSVISDSHDVSVKLLKDTRWLFNQIGRVVEVQEM